MKFTPPLEAVLFDLDDTLWQPSRFYARRVATDAIQLLMKRPWAVPHYLRLLQTFRKVREGLRKAGPVPNLHRLQAEITAELLGIRTQEVLDTVRPLIYENAYSGSENCIESGAVANLRRLKERGLKLGVLSDYPVQGKLDGTGLSAVPWDVLLSAEDVNSLKPNPQIFLRALEILNLPPEKTLYVGDRPDTDVDGARVLGLRTCLMRRRFRTSPHADLTVNSLAELTAILGSSARTMESGAQLLRSGEV